MHIWIKITAICIAVYVCGCGGGGRRGALFTFIFEPFYTDTCGTTKTQRKEQQIIITVIKMTSENDY